MFRSWSSPACFAVLLAVFSANPAWTATQWDHDANIQNATADVASQLRAGDFSKSLERMATCLRDGTLTEKDAEFCVALSLTLSATGDGLRRVKAIGADQVTVRNSEQEANFIFNRAHVPSSQHANVLAAIQRVQSRGYETMIAPEIRAIDLKQRVDKLEAKERVLRAKSEQEVRSRRAAASAAAAPSMDGNWKGRFECGPALRNPALLPPFTVPAAMRVTGSKAESNFQTHEAIWSMSGTIDSAGNLALTGTGAQRSKPITWALAYAGSIKGNTFTATGAEKSLDGKTVFRNCKLTLTR